jgi:replicative DNA helicase
MQSMSDEEKSKEFQRQYEAFTDSAGNRALPQSIEAEQALLGAILVNNDAYLRVSSFLEEQHFSEALHRLIYKVCVDTIRAGKKVTPVLIKPFLPDGSRQMVGEMTVARYVARLAAEAVTVINAEDYGRAIHDIWQRRQIIGIAEDIRNISFDAPVEMSPLNLAVEFAGKLNDIISAAPRDDGPTGADATVDYLLAPDKARAAEIEFPLRQITDVAEGNIRAGCLTGLLSSSGEGKTSLACQVMYNAAVNGSPVLFLSYDQSAPECVVQMTAQSIGSDAKRIREGLLNEAEYRRYLDFLQAYRKLPITIQKCNREGMDQLAAHAQRFVKRNKSRYPGTPLIVLDHTRRVVPKDPKAHEGRIAAEVTSGCKTLAGELDVCWLNLNQRNSAGLKRLNPRPNSDDIFGGEMAVQDYDTLLYLYRPDKYKRRQLDIAKDAREIEEIEKRFHGWEDQAEIGAIKVRFGDPKIRRRLKFEAQYTRYVSMRDDPAPMLFEEL